MMTMKDFRYGANPHEAAGHSGLPPLTMLVGDDLSLNAFLDLRMAFQVAGGEPGRLVYVKHALPLFSLRIDPQGAWRSKLALCFDLNRGRDFGCFVFTGLLSEDLVDALLPYRHHTLGVLQASLQAVARAAASDVQATHRGLVVVQGEVPFQPLARHRFDVGGGELHFCRDLEPDGAPVDHLERVVRLLRTLGAGVFLDGDLIHANSGFVDPLQLLEVTLAPLATRELPVVLATDACFSVKDPTEQLRRAGVQELCLFGGKAEHQRLVGALSARGLRAQLRASRAFNYVP